ncbi:MAG: site-2 protease family protein [bacterium]
MDSHVVSIVMGLCILLFSVIVHEVAHGYVAYRLGDPTAQMANRLSFNPLNHIDPVGSIILPLLLIWQESPIFLAWAKPVPVDRGYFRHPRRDDLLVSVAGVTANMVMALAAAVAFRMFGQLHNSALDLFLYLFCSINVGLAVFNMVPVPPLDGSHVLAALLPPEAARAYEQFSQFGFIIIVALMWMGALNLVINPIMEWTKWLLLYAGT